VIASLAAFFAVPTLFDRTRHITTGPFDCQALVLAITRWDAVAVVVLDCYLILGRGWSVLRTVGACALAGVVVLSLILAG